MLWEKITLVTKTVISESVKIPYRHHLSVKSK